MHPVRISRASAPILVRVSSDRSAADATVAEIAAVSADAVDAPTGAPIVLIAEATVTVAEIAARIAGVIAAVGASSAAAAMATARIADIMGGTLLRAGLN
jgi:hypothetical protein